MLSRCVLAVFSLALATQSFAVDTTGHFMVLGMGTKSCGTVVREFKKDSPGKLYNSVWVAGYLTAFNERVAAIEDVASGTDPEARDLWINNYCAANPLETLAKATTALVKELSKREH